MFFYYHSLEKIEIITVLSIKYNDALIALLSLLEYANFSIVYNY